MFCVMHVMLCYVAWLSCYVVYVMFGAVLCWLGSWQCHVPDAAGGRRWGEPIETRSPHDGGK